MIERIGHWQWRDLETATSTNDVLSDLLCKDKSPWVVTAQRQSAGRGRRGRVWVSEDGNLFASFAIKSEPKNIGQLVILSGLAVMHAVSGFYQGNDVQIKWPNDVLVDGAKISGILFERAADDFWIMGVGINVVAAPERGMLYPTTSLKKLGVETDRITVLRKLATELETLLEKWRSEGFDFIKKSWLDNAYKHGKIVEIKQDEQIKRGVFVDISDDGCLMLRTSAGMEKIIVGDLFGEKGKNE